VTSVGNATTIANNAVTTATIANGAITDSKVTDVAASKITGTLAVTNGGTGAATLTGLVKGNGTGAMTAAVAGTDYLLPPPIYTVGLNPGLGGYVFYVTPDGKHGLVAATQNQSNLSDWYNAESVISNPDNHDSDGQKFKDWRLPNKYELNLMYAKKNEIGRFGLYDSVWSSTQFGGGYAWYQYFFNGNQVNPSMSTIISVRAIRAF
jgi:hypothetical protein